MITIAHPEQSSGELKISQFFSENFQVFGGDISNILE